MDVLNGFMGDMFERLAEEAATLQKHTGRSTLSSREIQMAVRLVLPGELGKHAISEGSKAITNYYRATIEVSQAQHVLAHLLHVVSIQELPHIPTVHLKIDDGPNVQEIPQAGWRPPREGRHVEAPSERLHQWRGRDLPSYVVKGLEHGLVERRGECGIRNLGADPAPALHTRVADLPQVVPNYL
ncbi:Histone H2B-2 [Nymphaea thermarum]|nr:Histone H2B-2 [Nymphaea thermarum]